jgi:hypothetical protein
MDGYYQLWQAIWVQARSDDNRHAKREIAADLKQRGHDTSEIREAVKALSNDIDRTVVRRLISEYNRYPSHKISYTYTALTDKAEKIIKEGL